MADTGSPLAIALPHADRSGWIPSNDQLASRDRRSPARTSSRMSAAPSASQIARALRAKAGSGSSWLVAGVVPERRHHDAREVSRDRRGGRGQAVDVVVGVGRKQRVLLVRRAGRHPVRPRLRAVVGAGRDQDVPPFALRAGHHVAHGRGVVAVLGEDRPIGVAHLADEALSQLDDGRRRGRWRCPADPAARRQPRRSAGCRSRRSSGRRRT